jgi:hypothetical protein
VNKIGLQEKQGREFCFLKRWKEPYEWTNTVPEDDPEFQGLLEEEAPFPEMSAVLPGVPLKEVEEGFQVVAKEPAPDFETLAVAALENAGIDMRDCLHAAQDSAEGAGGGLPGLAPANTPQVIEAKLNKIVYDITFELPNAGLLLPPMNDATAEDNTATHLSVDQDVPLSLNTPPQ